MDQARWKCKTHNANAPTTINIICHQTNPPAGAASPVPFVGLAVGSTVALDVVDGIVVVVSGGVVVVSGDVSKASKPMTLSLNFRFLFNLTAQMNLRR